MSRNTFSIVSSRLSRSRITKKLEKVLLAINIGIILSCIGFLLISIKNNYYWRADFTAFYTGGTIIRDSLGDRLYNLELQERYQQEMLQDGSFEDGVLPYNYPPYVALFFLPLTYVPLKTAFYIWMIFQIILVVFLVRLLMQISAQWEQKDRYYLIVTTLSIPYLLITLLLGTFSLIMLIGILEFYSSIKTNHYYKAAFWLCILAFKPQILIVPMVFIVSTKRWRTFIVALMMGIFTFIIINIILGWHIWIDFFERLAISSTYFDIYGINPGIMHNLKGVLTTLLGSNKANLINVISLFAFLLMVMIVYLLWRNDKNQYSPMFDLKFSLSMTLAILFSPHVNPQDSLLLIAPLAIYLNYQNLQAYYHQNYILFLLSIPLMLWISEFWIKDSLIIRFPVLIMIIFLILSSLSLYKDQRGRSQKKPPLEIGIL